MDNQNAANILGLNPEQTGNTELIRAAYEKLQAKVMRKQFTGEPITADEESLDQAYELLIHNHHKVSQDGLTPSPSANPYGTLQDQIIHFSAKRDNGYISCLFCGAAVPRGLLVCPQCTKQFARNCPSCGDWNLITAQVCGRCRKIIQEEIAHNYYHVENQLQIIAKEQEALAQSQGECEAENKRFVNHGVIIWLIVSVVLIVSCILAFSNL